MKREIELKEGEIIRLCSLCFRFYIEDIGSAHQYQGICPMCIKVETDEYATMERIFTDEKNRSRR